MMCGVGTSHPSLPLLLFCVLGRAGGMEPGHHEYNEVASQYKKRASPALFSEGRLSLLHLHSVSLSATQTHLDGWQEPDTPMHHLRFSAKHQMSHLRYLPGQQANHLRYSALPRYSPHNRNGRSSQLTPTITTVTHFDTTQITKATTLTHASTTQIPSTATTVTDTVTPSTTTQTLSTPTLTHTDPFLPQHMFLCQHPPLTFSRDFTGHTSESCSGDPLEYEIIITRFCSKIFGNVFPDEYAYVFFGEDEHYPFGIINSESLRSVCLPLIRLYYWCDDFDYITICWDAGLIFINPDTCPSSHLGGDSLRYFAPYVYRYLVEDNEKGMRLFCEGICRLEVKQVAGVTVRLFSKTDIMIEEDSCFLNVIPFIDGDENSSIYQSANTYWPSCYNFYEIIWMDDPAAHGLNPHWSYLSTSCQVVEVVYIVLVGCVAVGGLVGNLLVVVVMMAGGHRGQESSILRTSMALADLLITVVVVCPAFYRHFQPFIYPSVTFKTNVSAVHYDIDYPDVDMYDSGVSLFQGLVLTAATIISLLTLSVLSFERLIITTVPLRYGRFFSVPRILLFVAFSWIDGTLSAILLSYGRFGFEAYYQPLLKIVIAQALNGPIHEVVRVFAYLHLAIFGLTVLVTIVLSITAIINFLVEETRMKIEWKSLKMHLRGDVKFVKRQKRYILVTQLLMTVFFLLSILPLGLFKISFTSFQYLGKYDVFREYFYHLDYIVWWLLLGGSAWNPWVYNMRSHQFREDAAVFLRRLVNIFSRCRKHSH